MIFSSILFLTRVDAFYCSSSNTAAPYSLFDAGYNSCMHAFNSSPLLEKSELFLSDLRSNHRVSPYLFLEFFTSFSFNFLFFVLYFSIFG